MNNADDLFYTAPETFNLNADSKIPPVLVAPPPTATVISAVDHLPPALPPSFFELQPAARAPFTPTSFVAPTFAPSASAPVSFASSQSALVIPSAINPDDDFANFWQQIDDSSLSGGRDVNSLATIPPDGFLPEVNDVNIDTPLSFGTIQFPIMGPLPTLPVPAFAPALESAPTDTLAAAPAPRRHHNSRKTAKMIAEEVTTEVTVDANGVPARRKPGRPRLPEGAPKAPYKKRNAPGPLPTTSPKPKRMYKKQITAPVD